MAASMGVTFLGTVSCAPSPTRNVSCCCVRIDGDFFMVDCGEATQHQVLRSDVRVAKIRRILITHLHGDHLFGLPGLLCTIGNARGEEDTTPLELVGPRGLRAFARHALRLSYSHAVPLVIHELHPPPNTDDSSTPDSIAHDHEHAGDQGGDAACRQAAADAAAAEAAALAAEARAFDAAIASSTPLRNEVGGEDIAAEIDRESGSWSWRVPCSDERLSSIIAAPLKHTVPCVGYVISEIDLPGKLDVQLVKPLLDRNKAALAAQGVKNPMALLSRIKNGETIELPDGTVVRPEDAIGPTKRGRRIVVLGDTCDSSAISRFAADCDLLVHEATNAKLSPEDDDKTEEQVEQHTIAHGHSTPRMAGRFARSIGARWLVLTHFSPRYRGDVVENDASKSKMAQIVQQAKEAFGSDQVTDAYDFLTLDVKRRT